MLPIIHDAIWCHKDTTRTAIWKTGLKPQRVNPFNLIGTYLIFQCLHNIKTHTFDANPRDVRYIPHTCDQSGVGDTKTMFLIFSESNIFDLANVTVRFVELHSCLTGVTAAQLGWHLSNVNVIFNGSRVFRGCRDIRKKTERKKLA